MDCWCKIQDKYATCMKIATEKLQREQPGAHHSAKKYAVFSLQVYWLDASTTSSKSAKCPRAILWICIETQGSLATNRWKKNASCQLLGESSQLKCFNNHGDRFRPLRIGGASSSKVAQSGRNLMAKKQIGVESELLKTKSGNDFFPLFSVAWKQLQKPPSLQSTARAKHAPIGHSSVFGAMAAFLWSEILKASPPQKKRPFCFCLLIPIK